MFILLIQSFKRYLSWAKFGVYNALLYKIWLTINCKDLSHDMIFELQQFIWSIVLLDSDYQILEVHKLVINFMEGRF